jgi:acyl-CoA thioester hydrolase
VFSVTMSVQIRFSDFDPLNHVNNVAFFEIMETARIEAMRKLPRSLKGNMVVRHASCDYEDQIRGGTRSVDVLVSVEKVGRSSFSLLHEITTPDGRLVARGHVTMVALGDGRSRPLTDEELAFLGQ